MTANGIVLIRHGQTEWSISGRHTGRTDIPLTDLGRQQADALGEMLDGESFPTVLSSPLQRAWETMERAGYAVQGMASQDILEWDYGVFEGRTTEAIRREIPDKHFSLGTATVSTLGWERDNRVLQMWNDACHLNSMDPVL